MTSQYARYIIALDNFGHDANGNAVARHTVYGTDDLRGATAALLDSGNFGGPMLYQTRKRQQVGYSRDRDEYAGRALLKAGARFTELHYTVGDRAAGQMYLIYTNKHAVAPAK